MRPEQLNTIRRGDQELRALLDELDREDASWSSSKRAHTRHPYRRAIVPIQLVTREGYRNELVMACRNISAGGMSLLHSSFVYPETRCRIKLRHRLRGDLEIEGVVARCSHVRGHIHEVGVRFREAIDVQAFADIDHLAQQYSMERVKPQELVGRIVVLTDNAVLLRIVQHLLRNTTLAIGSATDVAGAIAAVDGRTKLVLVDHDTSKLNAGTLIDELQSGGVQQPVLIMTADTRPTTREVLRSSGVAGLLKKPLEEHALLRALAEFILPGVRHSSPEGSMRSSLPEDSPLRPLVASFIDDLRGIGADLKRALEADDMESFVRGCIKIQGTAPSLGFEAIADLAADTVNVLNSTMSLREAGDVTRRLINQCDRAAA